MTTGDPPVRTPMTSRSLTTTLGALVLVSAVALAQTESQTAPRTGWGDPCARSSRGLAGADGYKALA